MFLFLLLVRLTEDEKTKKKGINKNKGKCNKFCVKNFNTHILVYILDTIRV